MASCCNVAEVLGAGTLGHGIGPWRPWSPGTSFLLKSQPAEDGTRRLTSPQGSRWRLKGRPVGPVCVLRVTAPGHWAAHRIGSAVGVFLVFLFPSRPCADGAVTWPWWVRRASPVQVRGTDTLEASSAGRSEGLGAAAVGSVGYDPVGSGAVCLLIVKRS